MSQVELRQFVDRAFDVSRASLVRDLRGFLLRFALVAGNGAPPAVVLSRATLGVEAPDINDESAENLAALSRMTLGDRVAP